MAPEQKLPFKISVLVFVRNAAGDLLLIERMHSPNKGLMSPIGGKLEMQLGESPFECAIRETREEIGLVLCPGDLHMFCMVSEKGYEGGCHWLMFLFDCRKRIDKLPEAIDEGAFRFVSPDDIFSGKVKIPDTDRLLFWDIWRERRGGGLVVLSADCRAGVRADLHEVICDKNQ